MANPGKDHQGYPYNPPRRPEKPALVDDHRTEYPHGLGRSISCIIGVGLDYLKGKDVDNI
jgi:hypothetical protein